MVANRPSGAHDDPFDVVIIGGGINGTGIARDAVLRGLSVAVFEKRDFGVGATANSSGMIHGGVRYLLRDPDVTRLACIDSGYIQKICSHLLFRIPFILPVLGSGAFSKVYLELVEVYFEAYDRYQPFKQGKPHCRLSREELRAIEPGITPRAMGAVTTDEWGLDAARLNLINALDAAENGAEVNTYHEVIGLVRDGEVVKGVKVRDRLSGNHREVFGRIVFNATGAWSGHLTRLAGDKRQLIRPGKGIHLVFPGRLTNYAIITQAIDGRELFISPNQNETWIGTTDDDYWGDLDEIPILEDEVKYLLNAAERVFPTISQHRIIRTMAGCRPTLYDYGPSESKLSREHQLFDHGEFGAANFFTLAGGKLASYRAISEEVTDTLMSRLGRQGTCSTHTEFLPGGAEHDLGVAAFTELGMSAYAAQRILYRHGSRAGRVLEMMRREPRTRAIVCACEPVTDAEIRVCLRTEMVRTVDDLRRRCRVAIGACGGADCAFRTASIFCEELSLGSDCIPDVARTLVANQWRDRVAVLYGPQMAQEEIGQAWLFLSGLVGAASTRPMLRSNAEIPAEATSDLPPKTNKSDASRSADDAGSTP